MIKMIIFCGSPGSGKTTLSKQIAEKYSFKRYAFDELPCIRHSDLHKYAVASLQDEETVILDGVFGRRKNREDILNAVRGIECEHIVVYMDTALDECINRNSCRDKPLSEDMVKFIHDSIEQPSYSEGWDEIIYIKEDGSYEFDFTGD